MDPQTDSRIVKLPQELIERIVDFLPTADLGSFRRTCKLVEHHLFTYFSKHYFTKKQFMISETSLRALLDISEHPSLSPCLKHLVIGLDHYTAWIPDVADEAKFVLYKRDAESQRRMFNNGRAANLLARALSNLKNLQTIDIRDFNSPTRFRDRETGSGTWSSWGAPTLTAQGHRLKMIDSDSDQTWGDRFSNRVFHALLAAMAESSARPQALMVMLRYRACGLSDTAFGLDGWLEEGIAPALAGLKTLHLDVGLDEKSRNYTTTNDPQDRLCQDLVDTPNTCIRHFLACTPNVTWLRLNFQNTTRPASFRLINWLATVPGPDPVAKILPWIDPGNAPQLKAQPPWSDTNPAPVALPLTQLDLGMAQISTSVLRDLFQKFPGLHEVSLFRMTLYPEFWIRPQRRVNLWANTFQALSTDLPPNLKSLKLRLLSQEDTERPEKYARLVSFDEKPDIDVEVSKKGLEELAEAAKVLWPDTRRRGGGLHVDDDEDGDEDGEDSEDEDDE